jgi:thiol-disulfide isomerase/thioredoxin
VYTCTDIPSTFVTRTLLEANKDKLVVMKVFAPWCRACKGLEPKFNAIVRDKKYAGLPVIWGSLTIQHNKDYVKSIGVLALPTVQFYAHGQRQDTFPCGPSKVPILKRKLVQFINQHVDADTMTVKEPSFEEDGTIRVQPLAPTDKNPVANETETMTSSSTFPKPRETVETVIERERSNLRSIPYFSGMSELEFESVLAKASLLNFESGSIIMKEGNMGRTFYVIVDGDVEICQRTSFEDPLTTPPSYLGTVINRFEQGEFFGERALITGEARAASISGRHANQVFGL